MVEPARLLHYEAAPALTIILTGTTQTHPTNTFTTPPQSVHTAT